MMENNSKYCIQNDECNMDISNTDVNFLYEVEN